MPANITKASAFLKDRYGIEVIIDDFPEEEGVEIGALSHKKILINRKSRGEMEVLFVMAHLFGHMVQFTNYEKYRYLVETTEQPKPLVLSDDFKQAFFDYEVEGYLIGKALLEEVLGKEEAAALDEKFQVYLHTDFDTFWDYLVTGNQITIADFNALLSKNYEQWRGTYTEPLESIPLPSVVDPKKDVVVY